MVDGFRPNQSIWSRGWEDSVILFPLSHWVLALAVMPVVWHLPGAQPSSRWKLCSKNSRVGSTCLDSIMHCLCCSTWLSRRFTWLKLFPSSNDSHPCASSYVTSDHELFSCPLYRLPPPQRERICFWKDPHGSWLETLSLRWNHVFWGVESWGCFSGPFC